MKNNFTHYYYLISCPSDIKQEIETVQAVLNDFNEQIGEINNLNIKYKYWKTHVLPESGSAPQKIINKQIVENSDGIIAIFWSKFGSPTSRYGSGTEEEIEKMLKKKKHVMIYFSNAPLPPSMYNPDDIKRIADFKKKYEGKGIYFEYSSVNEFEELLKSHINTYFSRIIGNDRKSQNIISNVLDTTESYYTYFKLGSFIRMYMVNFPIQSLLDGHKRSAEDEKFFEDLNELENFAIKLFSKNSKQIDILNKIKPRANMKITAEEFQIISELRGEIEISILKKLQGKESAAFQIGRSITQIFLVSVLHSSDDNHKTMDSKIEEIYENFTTALNISEKLFPTVFNQINDVFKTLRSEMSLSELSSKTNSLIERLAMSFMFLNGVE